MGIGRPSSFTQEVADRICERLAKGESLRQICADKNMPDRTVVIRWKNDRPAFRDQYARARDDQADTYFDLCIAAATEGDGDWQRARLAFDAYRWAASKLKPGSYGDKLQHSNSAGDGDVTVQVVRFGKDEKPT